MKIETDFYTIAAENTLCRVTIYASWDQRVAEDFSRDMKEVVARNYTGKKYGVIIDMRKWGLHTPDGETVVQREGGPDMKDPPSAQAFIVGQSELKKWQVNKTAVSSKSRLCQFFETLEQGEQWMASLGFLNPGI